MPNPNAPNSPMAQSVEDIYHKHQAPLKGYIARRVPRWEDAEDIVQNVFYQLSRIDLVENPIEHISAWLYKVARRQVIDRLRKHREEPMPTFKKRDEDEEFLLELSDLLSEDEDTPEAGYLRTLVWEELELALGELPPEQRSVFELNELERVPFAEISASTGIPMATLISRKRYAVLHLRGCLRELYDELLKA